MKMNLFVCGVVCSTLLAGCSCIGTSKKAGIGPSFKGPVGLQLYSLRADFAKDVPGTVKKTRDFGFTYVELAGTYGQSPEQFLALLKANDLKPIAGHWGYERYRDDLDNVVKEAKALGLKYAGCAWISHQGAFDEKTCRETIAVFNKAGEALSKEGMKFFYHTHGYEFQPYKDGTLFDLLVTETNPKFVTYEMDILWVVHPGQDPVKLLEKYPKRFELMHLKDLRKGVKGDLSGSTDVKNDVTLGTGQIDLPAVLKTAKKTGVKWYFIEDESPSVTEQLPQSLKYLEQVKF